MSNNEYVRTTLSEHFGVIDSDLSQSELVTLMASIVRQLSRSGPKTISVVGGAASGKTTIAEDIISELRKAGLRADMLSTDDYVVGDRDYRQQELKDADAQKKYDFPLMDEHIRAIRALESDKTVAVPVLDQDSGVGADLPDEAYVHEIGPLNVLLIEGDFPRDDYDIRFYVHLPDKQRLLNNIERETDQHDDADTGQLTKTFNDRQRTIHKPYTMPALQGADYVLIPDNDGDWSYTVYQRKQ